MVRAAALGIWEFVVGDDWRAAVGVAATLCATASIAAVDLPAWWISPIAILSILYWSVRRGRGASHRDAAL
jgi:hypothetical protein